MVSLLAFVAVLGLLIGFHEMAHLLVAKLFGVKVIRFSFGFGPILARFKIGETEYAISLLPIGGYVQPLSEDSPAADQEPDNPGRYFESKPAWQRFLIYLVGPLSNLLLAFLLICGLFCFVGSPKPTTTLDSVLKDSPAEQAGLKAGDKIIAINGEAVSSWEEITVKIQASKGAPVNLKVEREKELLSIAATPKLKETPQGKHWILGIAPKSVYEPQGPITSMKLGFNATLDILKIFADFFHQLFTGKISPKDSFGGPVTIYIEVGKAAKDGLVSLIWFSMLLSLNLFVMNILPIPLLDGGQIYPALFETLTGIKPGKRIMVLWQYLGIGILIFILLLGLHNDFLNLFKKN